jgi:hypothetical protein
MNRANHHPGTSLSHDDLAFLRGSVRYVGGEEGVAFKADLLDSFKRAYDSDRRTRIESAIRSLSESQILRLCEMD